jgi:hypothetical protein
MDILQIIKEQVQLIMKEKSELGLTSVITHIERAEFFLNEGKQKEDEHLFTDVVYRTNHAFEGILKEAYKILADKNQREASQMTPHEIEEYLLNNRIFNERVLELFKNYRKEWRNPSTHDYNLFFGQSEAFLAIVNVAAFAHVLLNQMKEKIFYDKEKLAIKDELPKLKKTILDSKKHSLSERLMNIILSFSNKKENLERALSVSELGLIGMLNAYISSVDSSLEITREPIIEVHDIRIKPDFIIISGEEKVIIEVKKRLRVENEQQDENQLFSYLTNTNIKNGILYFSYAERNFRFESEEKQIKVGDTNYTIIKIFAHA